MRHSIRDLGTVAACCMSLLMVIAPTASAAPGITADKSDVACLVVIGRARQDVLQNKTPASGKQIATQNLAQMTSYYLGKIVGRHPGQSPAAIAKGMNFKSPEMLRQLDLSRCTNEFKSVLSGQAA